MQPLSGSWGPGDESCQAPKSQFRPLVLLGDIGSLVFLFVFRGFAFLLKLMKFANQFVSSQEELPWQRCWWKNSVSEAFKRVFQSSVWISPLRTRSHFWKFEKKKCSNWPMRFCLWILCVRFVSRKTQGIMLTSTISLSLHSFQAGTSEIRKRRDVANVLLPCKQHGSYGRFDSISNHLMYRALSARSRQRSCLARHRQLS